MSLLKMKIREQPALFGFLAVLALQTAFMLFFCVSKQEYHIDEIYSYVLSNSYDSDKITNAEEIKNRWISGRDTFYEFVSVQPGEQFAYQKTYLNNTTDAHPPFFYFVLHTVSSLFPNQFSKWFGLSVNLLMFIVTQILLFSVSRRLFKGVLWQLLPATLYGFSPIAVDITLFIRMYALLTCLTLLLFYIHLRIREGTLRFPYLWCFMVTFLGVFTQYFFAIPALFLALSCCVFMIINKKFRDLLCYAVSMMTGVLLVFAVYPAAFTQISGSKTNNVGNSVSSHILDFSGMPKSIYAYLRQFLLRMTLNWKWLLLYCLLFGAAVAIAVLLRNKESDKTAQRKTGSLHKRLLQALQRDLQHQSAMYVCVASVVMLLTFLTIVHISGQFSYIRYIYHVMPIFFLLFMAVCYYITVKWNVNRKALAIGLLSLSLFLGLNTALSRNCEFLYRGYHKTTNETAAFLEDKPLVVLDQHKNHLLTGNLTLLASVDRLYISDTDEINLDELLENTDAPGGVVFLVLNSTKWSEGYVGEETMRQIVASSLQFDTFEEIGERPFSTMYWLQ